MKSLITKSLKLKAEAYQYQVMRFGNYRPHKPLTKAIASSGKGNLDPTTGMAIASRAMRFLILTSLLVLSAQVINAQDAISDKNIQECFRHSVKTPAAFDRCVSQEFSRVRDEKAWREARVQAGKDLNAGCGKSSAYRECFEELLAGLRESTERLHELGGSGRSYPYSPRLHFYRFRIHPWRYYPSYPPAYVPRLYFPFVPRRW